MAKVSRDEGLVSGTGRGHFSRLSMPLFPQMKSRPFFLIPLLLAVTLVVFQPRGCSAPGKPDKDELHRRAADEFFKGMIPRLKIELPPDQWEQLKRNERSYAEAMVTEGTPAGPVIFQKVSVKLKGSAGSFQHLDAKPGMTLSFDKQKGGDRFHGMRKIHLNNGAQDGTYLHEITAGAMARMAGVPASRCSHAFVELNGRDMGLYVVKESFTKDFLGAFFKNTDGDLFDGGFVSEINENTEKDMGDPQDKAGLRELIAACQEGDPAKRWERLGKILDIDRFITHCAMEDILCHWDGYSFNRNNYRFYRDPDSGKFHFFLHGMDQTFGDENFPVMRDFPAMVAGAVLKSPQGGPMYRDRVAALYENVLLKEDWGVRVQADGKRVQAAIATKDARWAKEYEGKIAEARGQVTRRIAAVGKQIGVMPKPVVFDLTGATKIAKGWTFDPSGGGLGDMAKLEGRDCLHLAAPEGGAPSWRAVVNLPAGKYRFEAMARTRAVVAVDDEKGKGAGLRTSGGVKRTNSIEGESGWKPLMYEFESPGGDVALVAELRAAKGEAWFALDTVRVVKGR